MADKCLINAVKSIAAI